MDGIFLFSSHENKSNVCEITDSKTAEIDVKDWLEGCVCLKTYCHYSENVFPINQEKM